MTKIEKTEDRSQTVITMSAVEVSDFYDLLRVSTYSGYYPHVHIIKPDDYDSIKRTLMRQLREA